MELTIIRQSVGYGPASQAILLATYRALALLPHSYLPPDLAIPPTLLSSHSPKVGAHATQNGIHALKVIPHLPTVSLPASPRTSRPTSPSPARSPSTPLPPINVPIFRYAWLALAGISTPCDADGFVPYMTTALNLSSEQIKVTNGESDRA